MPLDQIVIRDLENSWESLTLSLQAIARWQGVEWHYRTINTALGLSFMVSAPREEAADLSWWMTFGRDAFLIETGALFGVKISPLGPPWPTAVVPNTPEGFDYFQQQIKPRIQVCLAHNHPVLVWRGWPDYREYLWGIVTTEHPSELGLGGSTMWSHGQTVPLASPPHRFYLVEEMHPRQPANDELLRFCVRNIRCILNDRIERPFGIVTGAAACQRWLEWLTQEPSSSNSSQANGHYQMARFVTYNLESAQRFIEHYRDGLHQDLRPYLDALHSAVQGTINALATSRVLKMVEGLYATEDGRESLAAGVRATKDFLLAQTKTIDHLAARLGV